MLGTFTHVRWPSFSAEGLTFWHVDVGTELGRRPQELVCIVDIVFMLCEKLCTHGRPQELRVAQISTWDFPLDVQII